MNKAMLFGMLALALLGMTGGGAYAQTNDIIVSMNEQNGSGQTGAASITQGTSAGELVVTIAIPPSNVPQPAHIHKGTCANLDPAPAFPLTSVVNGESVTRINTTIEELTNNPYAINVHKSGPEASVYVSCGDITLISVGMPTSGSNQVVTLLALGLVASSMTLLGMKLSRRKV